jgi:hypothetical protein
MPDQILKKFLESQHAAALELQASSDLFEILPIEGVPPQRYILSLRAKGLIQANGGIVETDTCNVMIWFPDHYLRHIEAPEVLTYVGPHPRPWHPNMRPPFICAKIRHGTTLVELIYLCFEIWTWRLFGTRDDGLNPAASQWARNQPAGRFPVDRRPLKRRTLDMDVEVVESRVRGASAAGPVSRTAPEPAAAGGAPMARRSR